MERCNDCNAMALEGECLAAGRCVLRGSDTLERWAAVPGYEDMHQVSSQGRIKNLKCARGKQVSIKVAPTWPSEKGPIAVLNRPIHGVPNKTTVLVAEVVLAAFVCRRPGGCVVAYKDGNVQNVNLENLAWVAE